MPEDYSQGWIDLGPVATVDAGNIIRAMHSVSSAQGIGFLEDSKEPLTDEELKPWLEDLVTQGRTRLDYVRGRAVKQSIHIHDDHYMIREGSWYDHNDGELHELLARFGVSLEKSELKPHGTACQCDDCMPNHPIRDPEQALGLCGITDPSSGTGKFSKEANS